MRPVAGLCICHRPDGVIEVHRMPRDDPVLAKLVIQDLELSCERVECYNDRSVVEVRIR